MSLIYSRYASAANGGYVRVGGISAPPFVRRPETRPRQERSEPPSEKTAEKHNTRLNAASAKKLGFLDSVLSGGLGSLLPSFPSGFLPKGLDTGDILLLALFLLLYLESSDEDFLIILIVVAFSIFK